MAIPTTYQLKQSCKGGQKLLLSLRVIAGRWEVKGNKIVHISWYTGKTVILEGGVLFALKAV